MKKIIFAVLIAICAVVTGCGSQKSSVATKSQVDFTVVSKNDIPEELAQIIDGQKNSEFQMSSAIDGYTYIIVGYGEQPTGGYSIRVDEVSETDTYIDVKTTLMGPSAGEAVNKLATYPYIVLKIEYTDKNIVFD